MKQLNIFGGIDYLDDDGNIKRCDICQSTVNQGDVCSEKCAEEWVNKFISIDNLEG